MQNCFKSEAMIYLLKSRLVKTIGGDIRFP